MLWHSTTYLEYLLLCKVSIRESDDVSVNTISVILLLCKPSLCDNAQLLSYRAQMVWTIRYYNPSLLHSTPSDLCRFVEDQGGVDLSCAADTEQ